jgi:hypothetical protein
VVDILEADAQLGGDSRIDQVGDFLPDLLNRRFVENVAIDKFNDDDVFLTIDDELGLSACHTRS